MRALRRYLTGAEVGIASDCSWWTRGNYLARFILLRFRTGIAGVDGRLVKSTYTWYVTQSWRSWRNPVG